MASDEGFPAHAGIMRRNIRVFRGFPAHAGMDPAQSTALSAEPQVSPPTRGWTIHEWLDIVPSTRQVSPPTRGWTLELGTSFGEPGGGFPAHAGMDPQRPWSRVRLSLRATVSPPTRGWTSPCSAT